MSASGVMVAGLAVVVAPVAVQPAFASTVPFECTSNADALLTQEHPTSLFRIDLVTGGYTNEGEISPDAINAIGFNVLDNFVYGSNGRTGSMVRIGADGVATDLGLPSGMSEGQKRVVGDVDENGHYWTEADRTWYQIDLAPGSDTYLELLDSGPIPSLGDDVAHGQDWAWVPGVEDQLFRVGRDTPSGEPLLIAFDRSTKIQSIQGPISGMIAGGGAGFGAVYADADGNFYASDNNSGRIYRIDVATRTAELFSEGPASNSNDGARCALSAVRIDFGDAPNSYGTTIPAGGARHGNIEYDETTYSAALMLGQMIDAEGDGVPGAAADGDNLAGVDDEDGVVSPPAITHGQSNTVTVSATNNTVDDAVLAGWVDLDANGTFDEGELVSVDVPASSGTADYALTFAEPSTDAASTYARFRLFPEGSTIAPTGAVSGGEVEDYQFQLLARGLNVDKTSTFSSQSRAGDTVDYTVTMTNNGTADYTEAIPAVVFDDLSGVVDDAVYNDDAVASAGSAPSFLEPSTLSWTGPLAVGESVDITYSVTLNANGDGVVENVAWQPELPVTPGDVPPAPACTDGTDPTTGLPCAVTSDELPRLSIAKSADVESVSAAGGDVTYRVTVTNEGPGAYTTDAPAQATDDLSAVLDDAAFGEIITPSSGAVFDEDAEELTWSGPLAPGGSIDIIYTVSVLVESTAGDGELVNSVCVPASQAAADANCATVTVPVDPAPPAPPVDPVDPVTPGPTGGLAATGGPLAWGSGLAALLLLIAGSGVLMVVRRRNSAVETVS